MDLPSASVIFTLLLLIFFVEAQRAFVHPFRQLHPWNLTFYPYAPDAMAVEAGKVDSLVRRGLNALNATKPDT
jgi:hypothetical protein